MKKTNHERNHVQDEVLAYAKNTTHNKKYLLNFIWSTFAAIFVSMLFLDGYTLFEKTGNNYFQIVLNGTEVGYVGEEARAEELLSQARRSLVTGSDELIFMTADMEVAGSEVLFGQLTDESKILDAMATSLSDNTIEMMHRSYTVKVNEYLVSLASLDEVTSLLQAAIDKYDSEGNFDVSLVYDNSREFTVLTTQVTDMSLIDETQATNTSYTSAGVESFFREMDAETVETEEMDFDDYDLGILEMDFSEEVEIVETYLPESQLTPLEEAIEEVTKEQETASIYKVVAGDTLSEIAIKVNIPMDDLIAMNDALEDEYSTLQIDQELVITVPEPELSVTRVEQNYYEEIYDADVIYIENDEWYTTQQVVHQQPSAGFRRIVADVSFVNDEEVSREILKEEILMEAVPKIVERGTKIPPTYVKPISGGRLSSGFGKRTAPKKGASTYHKGVDWATPTGTSVYASCGGTVAKAGWGSGYGYVIYINHEDGRQTRYGHLSKILVSVGQSVKQGERIALSGNTGNSTGPHLHFEILINGSQVNPLKYLQ